MADAQTAAEKKAAETLKVAEEEVIKATAAKKEAEEKAEALQAELDELKKASEAKGTEAVIKKVTGGKLAVREKPKDDARALYVLPNKSSVEVIGEADGWAQISVFVKAEFLA